MKIGYIREAVKKEKKKKCGVFHTRLAGWSPGGSF
jgi:hypothetical protein